MGMRIWLLHCKQGDDAGGLDAPLFEWARLQPAGSCEIERRLLEPGFKAQVEDRRPDLIVAAELSCPAGPWAAEVLALGTGLVVGTSPPRAQAYRALAEQYPVALVCPQPAPDALGLAIWAAHAAVCRHRLWQTAVDELRQRLADRVIIERAKGVLVRRLGVSEDEAYRRLRLLSRRQRRPVRDIAQALLDAQELFGAEPGGADSPHEDFWAPPETPVAPSERAR
jgi:hypothetical protein